MGPIITLNQDTDTPARRELAPGGVLTYLFDRSRDSRKHNAPGQDFIAFTYDAERIAFAVCDGVSQSFYGDVAARFLGEKLVTWLAVFDAAPEQLSEHLDGALREWVPEATALVDAKKPGPDVPPMLRDALERKRLNGSETMFVAGLIDTANDYLAVCWMGDMRLWLWDKAGTPIDLSDAVWDTKERWSSRVGPKNGTAHTLVMPLSTIGRLTAHSDGIGSRAADLHTITFESLNQIARELAETPTSDDISVLDIVPGVPEIASAPLTAPTPSLPDDREPVIRWGRVEGASWYRIAVDDTRTLDVEGEAFFLPRSLALEATKRPVLLCVQAMASDRYPGPSSEAISVKLPPEAVTELAPVLQKRSLVVTLPVTQLDEIPVLEPDSLPPTTAVDSTERVQRGFHSGPMMLLALLLALGLSVGWYLINFTGR